MSCKTYSNRPNLCFTDSKNIFSALNNYIAYIMTFYLNYLCIFTIAIYTSIKWFVAYCTSRVLHCTEQQSCLVIISQPLCLLRSQHQLVEGEDSRIHPLYAPKQSCALGSRFTRSVCVWETPYPLFKEVDYPNPNVMRRSVRVPRSHWHTLPSVSSARANAIPTLCSCLQRNA